MLPPSARSLGQLDYDDDDDFNDGDHHDDDHGLPANSHHGKIQPKWEYLSIEHGGMLSRHIID